MSAGNNNDDIDGIECLFPFSAGSNSYLSPMTCEEWQKVENPTVKGDDESGHALFDIPPSYYEFTADNGSDAGKQPTEFYSPLFPVPAVQSTEVAGPVAYCFSPKVPVAYCFSPKVPANNNNSNNKQKEISPAKKSRATNSKHLCWTRKSQENDGVLVVPKALVSPAPAVAPEVAPNVATDDSSRDVWASYAPECEAVEPMQSITTVALQSLLRAKGLKATGPKYELVNQLYKHDISDSAGTSWKF